MNDMISGNPQLLQPAVCTPENQIYVNAICQRDQFIAAQEQEIQALHQQVAQMNDRLCRKSVDAVQHAYLQEVTRYENVTFFVEGGSQKPMVCIQNSAGNSIVKRLTECYAFEADYTFSTITGGFLIRLEFCTEQGEARVINLPEKEYKPALLYQTFLVGGGSISYGKQGNVCSDMLFRFVSALLAGKSKEAAVPGWKKRSGRWRFLSPPSFNGAASLLPYHILDCDDSGTVVFALARICGALMGRLPSEVFLTKPICLVSDSCPRADLALDAPPKEFAHGLQRQSFSPWIFIRGEKKPRYRSETNMEALTCKLALGPSPTYLVWTQELTPLQREYCLVADMEEYHELPPLLNGTLQNLITQIENNPDVFDNMVGKAYQTALEEAGGERVLKQDYITLKVVASVVQWFYSSTITSEQETKKISQALQKAIDLALTQWEKSNSIEPLQIFRNALYQCRADGLRVEPLLGASEDACKEACVFYDDTFYYINFRLLKKIIAKYIPSWTPSCLMLSLKEAEVMGAPVIRSVKTKSGRRLDIRFRPFSRAKLRVPGQRELLSL